MYCFGRFALDPVERRLYADKVPVLLGLTDIRLLIALVENAGTLISKSDLVSRVWGRAAVTDNALYVHINALRKVIGDDFILNKQGRGYRFVAQIQRARRPLAPSPTTPQAGSLLSASRDSITDGLSRLIGRSEQFQVISKLLARRRLVTLVGPGGVGKTRFALHIASKSGPHFPDGVWLVEFASLKGADLAFGATAAALGLDMGSNAKPLDALARHLARRRLLIVLDNCEHLISSMAVLCDTILGAAPGAKILATSRHALCCSGEQVFEIPPLAVPSEDTILPGAIRGTAAIELFIERATSANANFRLTDKDAPIAARICRRVDGLPLAIEMVAGWAGALGLEGLEAKLNGSVVTWPSIRTAGPLRHSTLSATLAWSFDLLSAPEQTVLRRLAVFAGPFNLQAAEGVAGDDDIPKAQVFEHLANLIRKSMVALVPGSQPQSYRLLEPTRAFMAEKLASSSDAYATRQRHARYVMRVLEDAMVDWEITNDAVLHARYRAVIDDLRDALDWAMNEDTDDAVALAGASWPLWRELSLRPEGSQRLSAAATRLGQSTPPALEARLRRGLGAMLLNTAGVKAAHAESARAVTLYRMFGDDRPELGSALAALGFSLFALGDIHTAEQAILEALALLKSAGWLRTLAESYSSLLCIEATLGRFDAARSAGENAVRLCDMAGNHRTGLLVAANLVQMTLESGEVDSAISAGRELMMRLHDVRYSDLPGFVLGLLAAALTARGDLNDALSAAREAAPLLRDEEELFWFFDHLALRAALGGRINDAGLIAGYADAIYQNSGRQREPLGRQAVERLRVLMRDALPQDEIARLGDMGAALTEDQAMTLALRA